MLTPNGGVFGRNPKFNNVTVDGNLTVNGDIALGDDISIVDTLTVGGATALSGGLTVTPNANAPTNNVTIGPTAGAALQSGGTNNVLIGQSAGDALTTSDNSVAIGTDALGGASTGAGNSVAIGHQALISGSAGVENTAVGFHALRSATGQYNVAVGAYAQRQSHSGTHNVVVGYDAVGTGNAGSGVVAVGSGAAALNAVGGTVAVGRQCLDANTTGERNTAIGFEALGANSTGSNSVAVGSSAGIAFGSSALPTTDLVTSATGSIFIGRDARPSGNSESNQIVIGDQGRGDGSNTTVLGNSSTTSARMAGTATSVLRVSGDTVRIDNARTPATAGAAGNAGDICWDADYIYVCVAANTWKRTAIATWP